MNSEGRRLVQGPGWKGNFGTLNGGRRRREGEEGRGKGSGLKKEERSRFRAPAIARRHRILKIKKKERDTRSKNQRDKATNGVTFHSGRSLQKMNNNNNRTEIINTIISERPSISSTQIKLFRIALPAPIHAVPSVLEKFVSNMKKKTRKEPADGEV